VPTGLIDDQNGVSAGIDGRSDFGQVRIHRLGIAPRQDEADSLALLRTDRAEDIDPFGALIVRCAGPCSAPGPTARDLVLLADPGFVLEPEFDLYARFETLTDRFDLGGEVFLNASTANSFCAK
jgi:PHP family Zn ribbon phosphoesterase